MSTSDALRLYFMLCAICLNNALVEGAGTEDSHDIGGGFSQVSGFRRFLVPPKSRKMVFNVVDFGARANDRNDDSMAFEAAWKKACSSQGRVTIVIPKGTYLVGPLRFRGPCDHVSSLTFLVQGYLKAVPDLSKYKSGGGWMEFAWIDGLTLTGGGTFDGQGSKAWPYNNCHGNSSCRLLPTNVKFVGMNRTVVQHISSVNSMFFHIALVNCRDFLGRNLNITAPNSSPNTDGIHIDRCSGVYISNSIIGTGDDCVSVGQGNSEVKISNIICGPGHGISVGSLGRYPNEQDVKGLVVSNCKMIGTSNGIRIKTWPDSPGRSAATNITFENIMMDKAPSMVKLSDIRFKNITGTSLSAVAVTLFCSKGVPCQDIYLEDVNLDLPSGTAHPISTCENVRAKYIGTQIPPPCA